MGKNSFYIKCSDLFKKEKDHDFVHPKKIKNKCNHFDHDKHDKHDNHDNHHDNDSDTETENGQPRRNDHTAESLLLLSQLKQNQNGLLPIIPQRSRIFIARLNGRNEVPPNNSLATGTLVALLSSDETRLDFALQTNGLTNITAAHFHDGFRGQVGPIVRTIFIDPITGSAIGSWSASDIIEPLTPALVQKLKVGGIYVNVHTATLPDGEIRGQVIPLLRHKKHKKHHHKHHHKCGNHHKHNHKCKPNNPFADHKRKHRCEKRHPFAEA